MMMLLILNKSCDVVIIAQVSLIKCTFIQLIGRCIY